jgi:hypothetical protein
MDIQKEAVELPPNKFKRAVKAAVNVSAIVANATANATKKTMRFSAFALDKIKIIFSIAAVVVTYIVLMSTPTYRAAVNFHDNSSHATLVVLLAAWVIIPPAWFVIEFYNFRNDENDDTNAFEKFKYQQDLGAKLWLAITLTIGTVVNISMH